MHHYGEDAVNVDVSQESFRIELRNHVSGAVITLSGPVRGVFEASGLVMDERAAMRLGHELAHFMRQSTSGTEVAGAGT